MSVPNALVSVIIPTYNRASLIRGAIESAIAQTYPHTQIIVVDDGSADDTAAIVRSYKNVQYIYQPNQGQASARNAGLRHAKGSYIASLDSDDVWTPRFLEKCIHILETGDLDFVFANWDQEKQDGKIADYFSEFPPLQPFFAKNSDPVMFFSYPELRALLIDCCPSPSSSVVIRRSSIVSEWNTRMHIGDDWCLLLDIVLSKERRVALIREKLWLKKINCNNIYDSRDHHEAVKYLYVEDGYTMLTRYARQLTKAEKRQLRTRYNDKMMKTAKHDLYTRTNFPGVIRMVVRGFRQDPMLFIKMIAESMFRYTKRKRKELTTQPETAKPGETGRSVTYTGKSLK